MKPTLPSFKSLLEKKETLLWGLFLLVGLALALKAGFSSPNKTGEAAPVIESLETFIPKGHLLIPIEVANADRLEGVLGVNGIVDLYEVPAAPGGRARLVGRRLRLLRAPMNPQSFAVLLRDAEVDRFLSTQGPYLASIRPLQESSHEVAKSFRGPQIEYHREENP